MVRYVVLVWHQDGLTRVPDVLGTWRTFEAAERFAVAAMKRWPLLAVEPRRMPSKFMRDIDPEGPAGVH